MLRVLLVDDNADHRFLTQRALAALRPEVDVVVEVAEDGAEALDRLLADGGARPPPDLVLLDIKMPRRDGLDVLHALRADARTRTLVVVMLTSSENAADVARARALGANGYVTKSMDPAEFRQQVHDAVRRFAPR